MVSPLLGMPSAGFAQSPLTDEPSAIKFLFKKGVPLPPIRPLGFAPANPMEPPKSDVPAPSINPLQSAPAAPLSNLTETTAPAALALPQTLGQATGPAIIPLPPVRPKEFGSIDLGTKPKDAQKQMPHLEPVQDLSGEAIIDRASAVLSEMTQFQAEFTQIDGTGHKVTGHLAVARPGRMRFDYNPPSSIVVIADGNSVGVIDRKLKTRDIYSLFLTPLKFLLKSKINLKSDISILNVQTEPDAYVIVAEDKSTFAGTSKIALSFDKRSLKIKQWTVTDPQGYDTTVILGTIDTETEPDGDLFVIPEKIG